MITATPVSSTEELEQIISLQKKYLKQNITPEEKQSQGFLTMEFTIPMLQHLHDLAPSVIIKSNNTVIAYAIVLLLEGRKVYPTLEPMFVSFENLNWKGKPLYDYRFYAMGQICVAKSYRSKGLFEMLYLKHKEIYSNEFDFIITEVSTSNLRSLNAHKRAGFETINTFTDAMDEWAVVLWDWK